MSTRANLPESPAPNAPFYNEPLCELCVRYWIRHALRPVNRSRTLRGFGHRGPIRLSANESPLAHPLAKSRRSAANRPARSLPGRGSTQLRAISRAFSCPRLAHGGHVADALLALIARGPYDPGTRASPSPRPSSRYGTDATLSGATVVSSPPQAMIRILEDIRAGDPRYQSRHHLHPTTASTSAPQSRAIAGAGGASRRSCPR